MVSNLLREAFTMLLLTRELIHLILLKYLHTVSVDDEYIGSKGKTLNL